MDNLIRYEIQERKYSSNAILGVSIDPNNGKEHKAVMVAFCSMKKKIGDKKAKEIMDYLNLKLSQKYSL